MSKQAALCLIASIVAAGTSAWAVPEVDRQEADEADAPELRGIAASRRVGAVHVDGALDEASWSEASPSSGFWQREPHEGAPPTLDTEFRVLFDDEALYVGVRAFDTEPDKIRGLLTRRDQESPSDWILVGVDSYHDRRTSFVFGLNPAGVQRDMLIYDDVMEDSSWNAVWEGAAAIDDRGWTAEFKIPYNQLRFADEAEQRWGFQVARQVQRTAELTFWTPNPSRLQQRVSLFGEVYGITDIPPARRIELLPYTIGGASVRDVDSADPFNDSVTPELGAGIDFKYGVTSNFTLAGTINPDFGQVEADPSQVNLTAQETFFQEKRPFFLEGADLFRFSLGTGDGDQAVETMFYSRRIGAPPSRIADGDFVQQDDATDILGAAKLSGKTKSGWSIGALTALTGKETARVATNYDPNDGSFDESSEIVEPLASYSVVKVSKDLNGGRTNLGFGATGVQRDLDGSGMELELHDRALSAGASLAHRTADGGWMFDLRTAASRVHGDPAAIAATQTSSARYFQRPDADHLEFDPTRTVLSGIGAVGAISRNGSAHWRGAVGFDARSPGFETNDLGFQRNADYMIDWAWVQYRDETPGDVLQRYNVNTNWWTFSTWAPELTSYGGNVNGWTVFNNQWNASLGVNWNVSLLETQLLRGGPAVKGLNNYNVWAGGGTDPRNKLRASVNGWVWQRPGNDSWSSGGNVGVTVQASSNFDVSAMPFFDVRSDDTQFVDEPAPGEYLLSRIDQKTVGLTLRANYTFSPTLSLQLYAQPFVSAGEYSEFKRPDQVRADDYDDRFQPVTDMEAIGLLGGRPDFNFREMRSTVVFRWEYRPGSTLFVIWNHSRQDFVEEQGTFSLGSDLADLAEVPGDHVLLLKLNYWWGV